MDHGNDLDSLPSEVQNDVVRLYHDFSGHGDSVAPLVQKRVLTSDFQRFVDTRIDPLGRLWIPVSDISQDFG